MHSISGFAIDLFTFDGDLCLDRRVIRADRGAVAAVLDIIVHLERYGLGRRSWLVAGAFPFALVHTLEGRLQRACERFCTGESSFPPAIPDRAADDSGTLKPTSRRSLTAPVLRPPTLRLGSY